MQTVKDQMPLTYLNSVYLIFLLHTYRKDTFTTESILMLNSPNSKIFVTFLIFKWPKNILILFQPFSLEVLNTLLFHHLFLPSSCQVSVLAATAWSSHTGSASFQEAVSWEKKRQLKSKVWKGKATNLNILFFLTFCTLKLYLSCPSEEMSQ